MRDYLNEIETGQVKNPETAAQEAMRPQLPKRFYKSASCVQADEGGWEIRLDERTLKTPLKRTVTLPSERAAQLIVDEWLAQEEEIDPQTMPATRLANTSIDGIADDPQTVVEDMLKFAGNDLLCYRASTPDDLVREQRMHWDGVLERCERELGAHFQTGEGIIHIPQSREAIAAIATALKPFGHPLQIGALHTFTTLTGSLLLALSLAKGWTDLEATWEAAHVDERWNARQWGEDYEARQRNDKRLIEMRAAHAIFQSI